MSDDGGRFAFSPREAAEKLSISERSMRTAIASGKVRVRRLGSRVLVPRAELERLLRDEPEVTCPR